MADISIIILTKNGQRYIDRCLEAVFSQKIDISYEVICVDSGSQDKTIEICKGYPVRPLSIKARDFNHGLTRNLAISRAKGEFIILMSQDAIPFREYWMSTLIRSLKEDTRIAGVYCRQIPREDADILTRRDLNCHLTARKDKVVSFIQDCKAYESLTPNEKYTFCNFDNVCSCIRRNIWEKIPFRETYFAEDIDWAKRVLEAGYKIVYEPTSAVIHSHNESLISQYRRSYMHHKRLYELFGVQLVSTWHEVILFSVYNILRDLYYIIRNKKLLAGNFQEFLTVPISSFLIILGQYMGPKAVNENITSNP